MHGGYIMIDCAGLDLTKGETEQTISGMYARVREAMKTGKPIFAENCIWGAGKPISPIQTFAIQLYDDEIYCTASTLQIRVKNTDKVTIGNMVGGD